MLQGRHWSKLICGRAVFIAAAAIAATASLTYPALAQPSWPTTWNSIGTCSENEPSDTNPASVDLVGAPGFPAAFTQTDANYLYLRERVDVNPSGPGTFDMFSWVVLIQTPGRDRKSVV